jgi:hypothetical protein
MLTMPTYVDHAEADTEKHRPHAECALEPRAPGAPEVGRRRSNCATLDIHPEEEQLIGSARKVRYNNLTLLYSRSSYGV